jgi:hypothetical protein
MDKQQKLASDSLYKWWRATRRYNEIHSFVQRIKDWLFPRRVTFELSNGRKITLINPVIKSFETLISPKPYDGQAQMTVTFNYEQAKDGCELSVRKDYENELSGVH